MLQRTSVQQRGRPASPDDLSLTAPPLAHDAKKATAKQRHVTGTQATTAIAHPTRAGTAPAAEQITG